LRTPRAVQRPAVVVPDTAPRFTVDGGRELETHLARTCGKIAAGVRGLLPRGKLEALLLGGGYGRGEGGVLRSAEGDRPYNDLEFYVFLRGNRHLNERRFGRALHVLGEILTPQAGVEVEFKIAALEELRRAPASMFSYDLVVGHRRLLGDERALAGCAHHREPRDIPLVEATRLLMNRCTGLLLAKERLARPEFTRADADFVARNIAKAELALGDATLAAHGLYHWSARERQQRLTTFAPGAGLAAPEELVRLHARGVEFKLHPTRSAASREELRALHASVAAAALPVWLAIESQRLGHAFRSARDYAHDAANKCPDERATRNIFVNAKTLGLQPMLEARAGRHPRERVLRTLPLLLWDEAALHAREELAFIQRELHSAAADLAGLVRDYRELWQQVN
jgi:hypothetical protein